MDNPLDFFVFFSDGLLAIFAKILQVFYPSQVDCFLYEMRSSSMGATSFVELCIVRRSDEVLAVVFVQNLALYSFTDLLLFHLEVCILLNNLILL